MLFNSSFRVPRLPSRRARSAFPRRPAVELLEDRTCPTALYNYTVIARTGTAGLTGIEPGASINDAGKVAFVGDTAAGQGIFVGDSTTLTDIDSAFVASNRYLGGELQINHSGDVAVGEREVGATVLTAVREWHAGAPNTFDTIATGKLPAGRFRRFQRRRQLRQHRR